MAGHTQTGGHSIGQTCRYGCTANPYTHTYNSRYNVFANNQSTVTTCRYLQCTPVVLPTHTYARTLRTLGRYGENVVLPVAWHMSGCGEPGNDAARCGGKEGKGWKEW
jgi:hypothetical protein